MSTAVDQDRAKRIYYNQKAIAAAGVSKRMKYGGLVLDVKAPLTLDDGRSLGVIAVSDDVYEQLDKDAKYRPALAAVPDGKMFKQIGGSNQQSVMQNSPAEIVDEDAPSKLFFERLENLLGDSLK